MNTVDPRAAAHLATDPVMARIMAATTVPIKIYSEFAHDVYLVLLESIVGQQISEKAAAAVFDRLLGIFPGKSPSAQMLLDKTADELRAAGLSYQKAKYVQSVAEFTLANSLEHAHLDTMTDEEIVQYLLPIKGVGRWTVEMLLMFVLDRPDVFPIDDLVIRQRMMLAYPEQTAGLTGKPLYRALHEIAESWRPYRTLASRYLWQWNPKAG